MNARPEDFAPRALTREELEAHWMPFTANRHFKNKPRILSHARGVHYWTAEGRQILDGVATEVHVKLGRCPCRICLPHKRHAHLEARHVATGGAKPGADALLQRGMSVQYS